MLIIITEDESQGRLAVSLFRLRADGIGWAASRGSRSWRGVIDRPGREDFKVSETSQKCDSRCTQQSEGGREKVRENVGTKAQL